MFVKPKIHYISTFKNNLYEVYSIRDNKNGFPQFLIYENKQWIWKCAKYFEPIDNAGIQREDLIDSVSITPDNPYGNPAKIVKSAPIPVGTGYSGAGGV